MKRVSLFSNPRPESIGLILAAMMLADTSAFGQTVGHWTFDRTDVSLVASPAVGSPRRLTGRLADYSDDVPGAFIYDPLTQNPEPIRRARSSTAKRGSRRPWR